MRADFEIPQNNSVPWIEETLTFQGAINLTAATLQFVYWKPDQSQVVRAAEIISTSPSITAATSAVVRYAWDPADTAVKGVFNFQWKFTLNDGTPMHQPPKSPTPTDPCRVWQTFEVTPTQ